MFDFIIKPLAQLFYLIYQYLAFENYGLTIVLFTLIIRLAMIPLQVKQVKSSVNMQKMQPKLQHLQKKYANNKERLQEEQMKMYNEMGYNPMSGCLPLLIQLPLILILFQVIASPLQYIFNYSGEQIAELCTKYGYKASEAYVQIKLVYAEKLMNMDFLGLKLGEIPTWKPNILFGSEWNIWIPLFLLAVVSAAFAFFSGILSQKMTQQKNDEVLSKKKKQEEENNPMGKMMYFLPLITLFFGFQVPAGLSLYWFLSNVMQTGIQFVITKVIRNKESALSATSSGGDVTIDVNDPSIITIDEDNKDEQK